MTQIEAIYQGGVFKPVGHIDLPENQRVRLNVQVIEGNDIRAWLERVEELQRRIVEKRGYFPDSTADIAADRIRFDDIEAVEGERASAAKTHP